MEKCICQICTCGSHRCGRRFLKDLLGQHPEKASLPVSETTASFRSYGNAARPEIIKPLGPDWNFKHIDYAPPFQIKHSNDLDWKRKDHFRYIMPEVKQEEIHEVIMEPAVISECTETTNIDSTKNEVTPMKSVIPPASKGGLVLPPLFDSTTNTSTYKVPLPVSQLPNNIEKIRKAYKPPEYPMDGKSLYMRDFQKWDPNCGIRAPNPKTGSSETLIHEDHMKPYNVPIEYLSTYREGYGFPPMDINKIKLCFEKEPDFDESHSTQPSVLCKQHADPKESFFNRAIFRTTYRDEYCMPCVEITGSCQHWNKALKGEEEKKLCPAAFLLNGHLPCNYEFLASCGGHDIFRERTTKRSM